MTALTGKEGGSSTHGLGETRSMDPWAEDVSLGAVLRRARAQCGYSLRQVEQRTKISNAHLSQIERGVIKRPDVKLLVDLAGLYGLDYEQVAEWAGYLDMSTDGGSSNGLIQLAMKLLVNLDHDLQLVALHYLEALNVEARQRNS